MFLFTDACFYAWMMLFLWMKSTALLDVMICCFVSFGSGPMCLAGLFLTRLMWCESVLASWFVTIHDQVYSLHTMRMRKKHQKNTNRCGLDEVLLMLWVCLDLSCVMSRIMLKKREFPGMILINTHSTAVEIQDLFRDLERATKDSKWKSRYHR